MVNTFVRGPADLIRDVLAVLRSPRGANGVMVHSASIKAATGMDAEEWAKANSLEVVELCETAIHVKLRDQC